MKSSVLLLYFALAVLPVACGKKLSALAEEDPVIHALAGKWQVVKTEGAQTEDQVGVAYHFEKDKLTVNEGGFSHRGKITVTDSLFSWRHNGASMTFDYHYRMEDDLLVIHLLHSDHVFYMEKME